VLLLGVATRSFRNLRGGEVPLSPGATVLFGPNGQGKTNFLEACYLACTLRPLRAGKLTELVQFGSQRPKGAAQGQPEAEVLARFLSSGGERALSVGVLQGKRVAKVDGKPVRDPDELFGGLAVVAFTPDDLGLVKGAPDGRRRLLDRAVQNRHPGQLADARDYLRALRSRNELLRQEAPPELIAAFDAPLARLGARLRLRRESLLQELRPHAERAFAEVTRGELSLQLRSLASGRTSSGLGDDAVELGLGWDAAAEKLEQRLLAALEERLPKDRERGFTSVGPHADDLGFFFTTHDTVADMAPIPEVIEPPLDGDSAEIEGNEPLSGGPRAARLFASQGQTRAVVLAFKIGEIENLRARQGRAPLLLLDDVSSELDPERNAWLMRYLRGLRAQVVLTTTDARLVAPALATGDGPQDPAQPAPEGPLFHRVKQGAITPVPAPDSQTISGT
jgi:DNA replication and repair protein RecF